MDSASDTHSSPIGTAPAVSINEVPRVADSHAEDARSHDHHAGADTCATPANSPASRDCILPVAVALPAHSPLSAAPLHYCHHSPLPAGTLVRVPLGQRVVLGVVWDTETSPPPPADITLKPLHDVLDGIPALDAHWRQLITFVAQYYQRSLGEVALMALPPQLRDLNSTQLARRLKKIQPPGRISPTLQQVPAPKRKKPHTLAASASHTDHASVAALPHPQQDAAMHPSLCPAVQKGADGRLDAASHAPLHAPSSVPLDAPCDVPFHAPPALPVAQQTFAQTAPALHQCSAVPEAIHVHALHALNTAPQSPALTPQQQQALDGIWNSGQLPAPCLLYGATGSGKTEVYMQAAARALAESPQAQVLILVPEINLTPQLQQRFANRFADHTLAVLHSATTAAQRLQHWLAAHTGAARIVLGTRMAILASLPHLALVVVDEEHDPSYKQQEGARYCARDLAIYRAHHLGVRVVLGSATPSLESWYHSRPAAPATATTPADPGGRYRRLCMPERIGQAALPHVHLVDMSTQPRRTIWSQPLLHALADCVQRDEQALILLNRRGYAPVLMCAECGWMSDCPHCSAYRVFHKGDRSLRCHHCGFGDPVPLACPQCGNLDILPVGAGTQRLHESLHEQLQPLLGQRPLRLARIDADSTRQRGSLETQLQQIHSGAVDIVIGTQMVAKGHDFRRISLVAAVDPDSALFSSDFRAPERLFALLMQAAGRAGRDARIARSHMWIQTRFANHPLFAALRQHDYPAFARQQLQERADARLPPFVWQALVRAEGRDQQAAQDFLNAAATAMQHALHNPSQLVHTPASLVADSVFCYPAIAMTPQRIANMERAQMLIEGTHRPSLHIALAALSDWMRSQRPRHITRWAIDRDPLAI